MTNKLNWKLCKASSWPKPNMQNSAYIKPLKFEL